MEIIEFVKKFCKNPDIFEGETIKIKNSFFLADAGLIKIKNKIKINPESAGIFLGETKNSNFYPSSALIDIISKNSDKKIFLNKKTAWLFICRRDVFGQG